MTRPATRTAPACHLRRLLPDDVPDCAEFDAAGGGPRPFSERELGAFLRKRECFGYVLEDRRGRRPFPPRAGFCLYWLEPDRLRLLRFTIRPACRGVGFGEAMMLGLLEQLEVHRRDTAATYVPETFTAGLTFLRDFGWRAVGLREGLVRMEWVRGGETAELGGEG